MALERQENVLFLLHSISAGKASLWQEAPRGLYGTAFVMFSTESEKVQTWHMASTWDRGYNAICPRGTELFSPILLPLFLSQKCNFRLQRVILTINFKWKKNHTTKILYSKNFKYKHMNMYVSVCECACMCACTYICIWGLWSREGWKDISQDANSNYY